MKLFDWRVLLILLDVWMIGGRAEDGEENEVEAEEASVDAMVVADEIAEGEEGEAEEEEVQVAKEYDDMATSMAGSGDGAPTELVEEKCDSDDNESVDGDRTIEDILAISDKKKCNSSQGEGEQELSGSEALAAELGASLCDMEGMDEKLSGCLNGLSSRVETLEQAILSGEGGGLEETITLVLVKKGLIDCENNTQCADDRACLDSNKQSGRKLCELVCERQQCPIPHSECAATKHESECVCKEGFHGNGTQSCVPDGFTQESNEKHYRIFDDEYVEFDEAHEKCKNLGARLPVLDSTETIDIIKKYLETGNFSAFEPWGTSSRRVWVGLMYDRYNGLIWSNGKPVQSYPASSRLFVWEARRLLSVEASKADSSRHYGFYIDGDIAKLPGGGRKGAAVLCELLPQAESITQNSYDYDQNPSYGNERREHHSNYPDYGYPNYPGNRNNRRPNY